LVQAVPAQTVLDFLLMGQILFLAQSPQQEVVLVVNHLLMQAGLLVRAALVVVLVSQWTLEEFLRVLELLVKDMQGALTEALILLVVAEVLARLAQMAQQELVALAFRHL